MIRRPPRSTLFPYTDALPICPDERPDERGRPPHLEGCDGGMAQSPAGLEDVGCGRRYRRHRLPDRKSTRLNSSHPSISYAVFCLKKKITTLLPVYVKPTRIEL